MKTTKPTTTQTLTLLRTTANPQRTTLVEAAEPGTVQQPERVVVLPARTANPRRTVLLTAPGTPAAQEAGEEEPAAR